MAEDKLACTVEAYSATRVDRLPIEITKQFLVKRCGGWISLCRIGIECRVQNGIEIPAQLLAQRAGREVGGARQLVVQRRLDAVRPVAEQLQRMAARQQYIQQHAELV